MIGPDGTCPICGLTGCYREACADEHGIRESSRDAAARGNPRLPTNLETAGRDLAREALAYLAHQGAEGQPEDMADSRLEREAATYLRTFLETRRAPR